MKDLLFIAYSATTLASLANASATVAKRDPFPNLTGYNYYGCYTDAVAARRLDVSIGDSSKLTLETCATACKDYTFFGVEFLTECYCGNELGGDPVTDSDCGSPCAGNPSQKCGGGFRISVFAKNIGTTPSIPATVQRGPLGCYTLDGNAGIEKQSEFNVPSGFTAQMCEALCGAYKYYSLRYGSQCQCGDVLKPNIGKMPDAFCNTRCNGDTSERCGDTNLVNIYAVRDACGKAINDWRVPNPGFENGKAYWSTYTSDPTLIKWSATDSAPYQGRRSARFVSTSTTSEITISQFVEVCAGQNYILSLWAKEETGSGCLATLSFNGNPEAFATTSNSWFFFSTIISAANSLSLLSIMVSCLGPRQQQIIYIDNIAVKPLGP